MQFFHRNNVAKGLTGGENAICNASGRITHRQPPGSIVNFILTVRQTARSIVNRILTVGQTVGCIVNSILTVRQVAGIIANRILPVGQADVSKVTQLFSPLAESFLICFQAFHRILIGRFPGAE